MNVKINEPPRRFRVGSGESIELVDCARIELSPEEQVTFTTPSGGEYDVVRKKWGFYATPSLNSRLPATGFRPALVRNVERRDYVVLVERGFETDFQEYARAQRLSIVTWLDASREEAVR